jgi:uncharacterized protein YkwD
LAVAIAVGAIVAAALLATIVPSASATSSTPTMTLTMTKRGWVNVQWRFTTTVTRTNLTLLIQRGDTTGDIANYMTVRNPRQRSSRYDQAPMRGTDYYRIVLLNSGNLYAASATASIVDSAGGTTPPTSAQPTTTTTTVKATTTTTKPVTTTTKATTTTTVKAGDACSTAIADVERLVNADRKSQGKPPLADNAKLDKAAQTHTAWMASTGNFSHSGWDTEIANAGYKGWTAIGQNIAAGQTTAASVESAWFNETPPNDGHRQNILNAAYTNMGIGCTHVDKGYGFYWAEDFGNGS